MTSNHMLGLFWKLRTYWITVSCTDTVLGRLQYCFSFQPITHTSKTKLIVVAWITPYPLKTPLSPSPRSCDAVCKSRTTKHKIWSLQLLLYNDMSIRFGQGPLGDFDLWLPKMHTENKRFTTHEPKLVEAYSWSQMKVYALGCLVSFR